ncbi:MAG TPA: PadR family transcriptional regulator [Actinomycetota bacterium]
MATATSKVEVVVLGLLAEEPLYGYDLLERFRARSMGFWVEVGKASVYQVLKRLEREGAISGKAQEGNDGPDRRVFRITKTGWARLRKGLSERFVSLHPYETDAGLALGFAHLLPAAEARAAADAREASVRDLLDAVTTELSRTSSDTGSGRAVSTAMLQQQAALAKAELAWLKTYRSALSKTRR